MDRTDCYEPYKKANKIYGAIDPDRFRTFEIDRVPLEIIEALRQVEDITCELSDTLDRLGFRVAARPSLPV
jgi:hypothetical protein